MGKTEKWEDVRKELFEIPGVAEEYAKLPPVEIAAQIINARQKKGLSQAELAKIVGTKQPAIARLESGKYEGYSLRILKKIAEVLDQTIEIKFKPKTA